MTQSNTSVSLSWSQPDFSLPVVEYAVSLTRVTGSGQTLCPSVQDGRSAVATIGSSVVFADLEEFSAYEISVTALYDVFNRTAVESSILVFNTTTAGKSLKSH